MKTTSRWRFLPAFGAGALLVLAAVGAASNDGPGRAVPDALYYPNCSATVESSPHDQVWTTYGPMNFIQPLKITGNIAACSLYVGMVNSGLGELTVGAWDPLALAPDFTSTQMRMGWFSVSGYTRTAIRMDFVPPLVLKTVSGTAEPPRATVALGYLALPSARTTVEWTPSGPTDVPAAFGTFGSYLEPLPGPHPALTHWVCGGDSVLQSLYVTQSVVRTDTVLDSVECYAQRFRVPTRTQVFFVEAALASYDIRFGSVSGNLSILDAQGQAAPPTSSQVAMAQGAFPIDWSTYPCWVSHGDFSTVAVLEPNHDYWLWIEPGAFWRMYTRNRTGTEGPHFVSGIGPLYRRGAAGDAFALDAAHTLDFKIIGIPQDPTAVPAPSALVSLLHLRVMPNPARGASLVTWSGASGNVRFEVMDERGRRVSAGAAEGGASGQWLWRGADDDGHPLAAGVYFVRAKDAAGHAAVERVVLVR